MNHRGYRIPLLVAIAAILISVGCAGNPAPGESGYRFNLNGTYDAMFSAQGMDFTGTADLSTAEGGAVTGTVRLTNPETVSAELKGMVADSTFSFESTYSRAGGCEGALLGGGEILSDGVGTSGDVDIADDCMGGVMEGSFRFTRSDGARP
ncbi:MAG: hypothetical protein M8840_04315 [marine benthic group bacterium]|jgi:hypothetical protein|nr:hypothetical protein [Gemmatimonadota bacterium]MCL7969545.1 hypothetical protein [Gemmatimonadota bacterium]MCL7990343.1 hypothetical protein [Gemmatimonadota bacterium]